MEVEGCVALVTGANRGLGKAFAEALLEAGAGRVYAGSRDPAAITDPRLTPVSLDITSREQAMAAAAVCGDVNLLINNAGIMLRTPILADGSTEALRQEFEVNVFGTLAMIRAFAPVLARNGGGAMVNILSVASWVTSSLAATYGASKHAELAITEAARIELRAQGTLVVGVYAGFIDTEMSRGVPLDKVSPRQVAERTLQGLSNGVTRVLADGRAEDVWNLMRQDPDRLEAGQQQTWDNRAAIFGARAPSQGSGTDD